MKRSAIIGTVVLFTLAAPTRACNVPVFRFALERWKADNYEVLVFHRGKLTGADAAAVNLLKKYGPGEDISANLDWTLIDLEKQPDGGQAKLYETAGKPELPWMLVRVQNLERQTVPVWSGKATEAAVKRLVDSPLRREVAKRIAAGETAVWLFLETGDVKKDEAAFALLEQELKRLPSLLKLPALTDSPEDKVNPKGPPLKLSFSVLRIKKGDPAEEMLRAMLLNSEDDLADKKEPMTFPIFGRGRTLGGLIGAGITAENIREGCGILVAPCSCKVKAQQIGFDLLISFDWDAALRGDSTAPPMVKEKPPEPSKKSTREPVKVPLPSPKEESQAEPQAKEADQDSIVPVRYLVGGIGVASLLVFLTGFWMFRCRVSA